MIRALIFDFDGLILETEGPVYQSWQELYEGHGCYLDLETWAAAIGTMDSPFDPLAELEARAGHAIDAQDLARRQQREAELIAGLPPRPGVRDYLETARRRGLKIGLASSSPRRWLDSHLPRLGLSPYFDCMQVQEDVPLTKPDPALYLAALDCLGVCAGQALAFEDSPNGVQAAIRAGIFCVAVPNTITAQLPLSHANLRIESFTDLSLDDLLQRVNPAN